MRKTLIICLAFGCGFAGWANAAHAGLFSATGPVIAILADRVFVGIAEGSLGGTGTVAIRSQAGPEVTCIGEFTSSAARGGAGQLRCSDGTTATFRFQCLGMFSGHGEGSASRGPLSFTYGLTADESESYLKVPAGKKLTRRGEKLALIDN